MEAYVAMLEMWHFLLEDDKTNIAPLVNKKCYQDLSLLAATFLYREKSPYNKAFGSQN